MGVRPKKKILLIDDDKEMLEEITEAMDRQQYCYDFANDGLTAQEMLKTNAYELVVLDIKLPGMNGIEIVRWIKAEGIQIKVIVLTGRPLNPDFLKNVDALQADEEKILQTADALFNKPCYIPDLFHTIDTLLKED